MPVVSLIMWVFCFLVGYLYDGVHGGLVGLTIGLGFSLFVTILAAAGRAGK